MWYTGCQKKQPLGPLMVELKVVHFETPCTKCDLWNLHVKYNMWNITGDMWNKTYDNYISDIWNVTWEI